VASDRVLEITHTRGPQRNDGGCSRFSQRSRREGGRCGSWRGVSRRGSRPRCEAPCLRRIRVGVSEWRRRWGRSNAEATTSRTPGAPGIWKLQPSDAHGPSGLVETDTLGDGRSVESTPGQNAIARLSRTFAGLNRAQRPSDAAFGRAANGTEAGGCDVTPRGGWQK